MKKKIMWRVVRVCKVSNYKVGNLYTDEYMQKCHLYRKTLEEVVKMPIGTQYGINHPLAALEFRKVRTRDYRKATFKNTP